VAFRLPSEGSRGLGQSGGGGRGGGGGGRGGGGGAGLNCRNTITEQLCKAIDLYNLQGEEKCPRITIRIDDA
jgi:hypothetical protein